MEKQSAPTHQQKECACWKQSAATTTTLSCCKMPMQYKVRNNAWNYTARTASAVHGQSCGCGIKNREMFFVCPQCDQTKTRLYDWNNTLHCNKCGKVTAEGQQSYLYRFHCKTCGARGIGHHFVKRWKNDSRNSRNNKNKSVRTNARCSKLSNVSIHGGLRNITNN